MKVEFSKKVQSLEESKTEIKVQEVKPKDER